MPIMHLQAHAEVLGAALTQQQPLPAVANLHFWACLCDQVSLIAHYDPLCFQARPGRGGIIGSPTLTPNSIG